MNRILTTFSLARSQNRKLLCPFLTAGYPSLDATTRILQAAQHAGASMIELGIPFSDPVADGPVIQASFTHALTHGATLDRALTSVLHARQAGVTIPILAMVSFSIIFKRGVNQFASACTTAGIDGVILPDLPLEEAPQVVAALQSHNLLTSLLIAPTTPPDRRAAIAKLCTAFIYYLSVSGITGVRTDLPPDIAPNIQALRALTNTPICVGFGISTPAHVRQVVSLADGAIVGSALIRRIAQHLNAPLPTLDHEVQSFLKELATGLS